MTAFRFFVIIVIFIMASIAWMILGGTLEYRTHEQGDSLTQEIDSRWGPSGLVQPAPQQFTENTTGVPALGADPVESNIQVDFIHSDRYMGLIWFSTYKVEFSGTYTLAPRKSDGLPEKFQFTLPSKASDFENLTVAVDSVPRDIALIKVGDKLVIPVTADEKPHTVTVGYRTQGRDRWEYDLAHGHDATAMVKKFALVATTNFRDIDYPKGSASPTPNPAVDTESGKRAEWHFENRSTRQRIGIEMPSRQNAGPVAARMAFFAPVSLLFFFTVLFTIVVLKKIPLHPMHYLFISAGFFAFHILMAYLVDKIDIHEAFWICAAVSVFLVTSYMRLVAGVRFAVFYAGLAQLVYLIGFSYAFFWTGWTGLSIVIAAIVTLFVLMQATGRINWNEVFTKSRPSATVLKGPEPPRPV